ncbi:uncharacterized protein LOC114303316 isoform X2 [Camellia sinensis]|nr:uncharacterized protein LOC114303316 isoform X2 [Camellia sinensis]XP_028104252.1 uncharacterized protein LOC114303316 isoform X2 [Camellia sinensis]XP_028104253.1 uncharacterized protein LOC114303316 isoform X2 [Camellia sinensis]
MPSSQTIIRILLIGAMHMGGIYVGISVGLEASRYVRYRRERASDLMEYNRRQARASDFMDDRREKESDFMDNMWARESDFMDNMWARYYEKKDVGSSSDKSG